MVLPTAVMRIKFAAHVLWRLWGARVRRLALGCRAAGRCVVAIFLGEPFVMCALQAVMPSIEPASPANAEVAMLWVVTRHAGAMRWLDRQRWPVRAQIVRWVPHLDLNRVEADHAVIGTLPIHWVARLCARGVRYWHLVFDVPEASRGLELTDDALAALGAALIEYRAQAVSPAAATEGR